MRKKKKKKKKKKMKKRIWVSSCWCLLMGEIQRQKVVIACEWWLLIEMPCCESKNQRNALISQKEKCP